MSSPTAVNTLNQTLNHHKSSRGEEFTKVMGTLQKPQIPWLSTSRIWRKSSGLDYCYSGDAGGQVRTFSLVVKTLSSVPALGIDRADIPYIVESYIQSIIYEHIITILYNIYINKCMLSNKVREVMISRTSKVYMLRMRGNKLQGEIM